MRHWMNIYDGLRVSKFTIVLATVLISVPGCSDIRLRTVSDRPITVSTLSSGNVDIEFVIANAKQAVDEVLPGAHLTFFSYVGDCSELTKFLGIVNLYFAKTEKTLFGTERIYLARVQVDTIEKVLGFEVKDETLHYPNVEPLVLGGKSITEIATGLQTFLRVRADCSGTIVLQRSASREIWAVRCGPPELTPLECLAIDPITGEIMEGER